MCRALSHAVSEGAISRSCAPATGVEAFGQPWGAPSGHTWNAQRPDAHLPPVLRPSAAGAMGAPASATPRAATTHGRSNRPPSPGSAAARPWPIPSRWWAEARRALGVDRHGAAQSYDTPGRAPVGDLTPRGAYTAWRYAARSPPPAGAGCDGAVRQTPSGSASHTPPLACQPRHDASPRRGIAAASA
jgi:hypothetical protein